MLQDQDYMADGGAIQAMSTMALKINNSSFNGNFAYGNGGAVRISKPPINNATFPITLTISRSNFTSNFALSGGAVFANKTLRWVSL